MNDSSATAPMLTEERDGTTIVLTLNNPQRRNALAMPLREGLIAAFESIETDRAIRAVVLTGAGGTFCAGGDITAMNVKTLADGLERFRVTHRLVRLMIRCGKPIVAAVEGYAVGAGLSLAAERIGLVDHVVPKGAALDFALQRARAFADAAPLPVALTKGLLSEGLDEALERERELQSMLFLTADHAEGRDAFLAKRRPIFKGA
jgi:2-(1,2-epoxy-1,2-dihydrophenyl)acetyl-CoA isomerase